MSKIDLDMLATVEVIRKGFILPLLDLKPETMTDRFFIEEQVFHFSERLIQDFFAVEPFKMRGNLWITPHKKVTGLKHRDLQSGTEFCVRRDATIPDCIDVEITRGAGKDTGNVYTLTVKEWQKIRPHLQMKSARDGVKGGYLVEPDQCTHRTASGYRCRQPVWQKVLCERHLRAKWSRDQAARKKKAKELQERDEKDKKK
jgi:hypothetical protein